MESKEQNNTLIRVFCGISIEDKCRNQLHPVNEVKRAKEIVDLNKSIDCYSNSPDFIVAIKYYAKEKTIKTEFYLDDINYGDNTEPIFNSFNKAFDLINELCPNVE